MAPWSCFPITKKQSFVTLPDVPCVLFCLILDRLCDWWGLGDGFCLIGNTGTSSSTLVSILIYHLCLQLSISSCGDADMPQRGFANKIRWLQFGFSFFFFFSRCGTAATKHTGVLPHNIMQLKQEKACWSVLPFPVILKLIQYQTVPYTWTEQYCAT